MISIIKNLINQTKESPLLEDESKNIADLDFIERCLLDTFLEVNMHYDADISSCQEPPQMNEGMRPDILFAKIILTVTDLEEVFADLQETLEAENLDFYHFKRLPNVSRKCLEKKSAFSRLF